MKKEMTALSIIKIVLKVFSFLGCLGAVIHLIGLYAVLDRLPYMFSDANTNMYSYGFDHVLMLFGGFILMIIGLASMTALLYMKKD